MNTQDERKKKIFKRLKEHYNHLAIHHDVFGLFLHGSQNYELDVNDDNYQSDIDSKAIIIPSIDDIINDSKPISMTIILDNGEQIDVKDIRIMFDNFIKSNAAYLEILFTKFKIINPFYKKEVEELLNLSNALVDNDFTHLVHCLAGMSSRKFNELQHPYPTVKNKLDKFGYDPKQLHHILRINDFLKKTLNGVSFKNALIPDNKEYLINLKKGILPLKDALKLADDTNQENQLLCNIPYTKIKDSKLINRLNNIKVRTIKKSINLQLKEKRKNYNKIFVTSDNHFYHKNIIAYESRPFTSIETMNEEMIKKWNKVVSKNDLTYILGDFSFGNSLETEEILKRLNGDKILIVGNHDLFLQSSHFNKSIFIDIKYYDEVTIKNVTFVLCHYPFAANDHTKIQLYGHIHSNIGMHQAYNLPSNSYNVGVDINDYTPICLDDLLYLAKEIK